MHLLPQDLMCDKWPISAQTPTGPWPEGARSLYLCYVDVFGTFIGASLCWVKLEMVAEHVGLWKCTLSRWGVRGMSFPLEDVFILVCLCACWRPRVAGTHLHPHRPWVTLWKSSAVCVCASSAEVLCDYADCRQSQRRYQASGVREVLSGWYCRWRANAL